MLGNMMTMRRCPRNDRVFRLATTGAVQKIDLTATNPVMSGTGNITIRAVAQDVQLYFCNATQAGAATIGLDSTTAQQMGYSIPSGQQETFELTGADTNIILISRATGGFIELFRSGQERTDQR